MSKYDEFQALVRAMSASELRSVGKDLRMHLLSNYGDEDRIPGDIEEISAADFSAALLDAAQLEKMIGRHK